MDEKIPLLSTPGMVNLGFECRTDATELRAEALD
jgi:hypothetical protein